jgi:hypothetical protein
VGLVQLVRFLVMELTNSGSNPRFDMCVVFILSIEDDVSVDSDTLLVIDFVNLKIKPTQSFGCTHKNSVCVFIGLSTHMMSIYVCTMFQKNGCRLGRTDTVILSKRNERRCIDRDIRSDQPATKRRVVPTRKPKICWEE